jgi:predicted RNase H-like HicB family nuclease
MKKTVDDYMDLPYTFLTIKQPDGTFFIKVKELEGCMSVGDSIEDAYVMIRDAMKSWISLALEEEDPIPAPESLSTREYSGKFVVRTPTSLHRELAGKAEENHVSLNTYVVSLLSRQSGIMDIKDQEIGDLRRLLIGKQKTTETYQ